MMMNRPRRRESSYSGIVLVAQESCEDFNVRCKRRQGLLNNLSKALGANEVPGPFWACVQVCDLGQLEVIVDNAQHVPFLSLLLQNIAVTISHYCGCKKLR